MVQESCVDCAVVSDFLSDPLHLIVLLQPIVTPFLACELQQRFHFWSACSHLWVCLVITISSRFYLFCTFSNHPSHFTCTFHVYRTKNYIIHYVFSRYFLISVNKINIILHTLCCLLCCRLSHLDFSYLFLRALSTFRWCSFSILCSFRAFCGFCSFCDFRIFCGFRSLRGFRRGFRGFRRGLFEFEFRFGGGRGWGSESEVLIYLVCQESWLITKFTPNTLTESASKSKKIKWTENKG